MSARLTHRTRGKTDAGLKVRSYRSQPTDSVRVASIDEMTLVLMAQSTVDEEVPRGNDHCHPLHAINSLSTKEGHSGGVILTKSGLRHSRPIGRSAGSIEFATQSRATRQSSLTQQSPWHRPHSETRIDVADGASTYGFFFFLSAGLSEKSNQASTTKPIATPVTASHVPSLSISSSCLEVLVAQPEWVCRAALFSTVHPPSLTWPTLRPPRARSSVLSGHARR